MNLLTTLRHHWRLILLVSCYLLLLIATLYRIAYIIEFNPVYSIWSDPQRHWEQGIDVLRQDPMVMTDPILFQLYMGTLAKLTLKTPALVAFYTCLLSVLMPWVWYRFLRELQPSKLVAVAGWAAIAIIPSWISIYGYFMQETLMLPLLGAALWLTWRCRRKQTLGSFALMILFWVLAGLTRGICIPMAAVAATWLWLEQPDKLRKAGCALLIFGVTLGPLVYRTYQFMGIVAPHGIGHLNVIYSKSGVKEIKISYERQGARWYYGFMSPALLVQPLAPLSDWQTRRKGKHYVHVDIDKGGEDWDRALAAVDLPLGKYLWITRENLIFLFFGPSWPDSNRERWLGEVNYQTRWLWAPLFILCLVWTIARLRRQPRHWLLPGIILAWFVVQGLMPISVNEGRYRKPLEGLLVAQLVLLIGSRRTRKPIDAVTNAVQFCEPARVNGDETACATPNHTDSTAEPHL